MDLTPQDRDLLIRTVIGEAADQPDEGQAAVAHVVLNRTRMGDWGKSPTEVVLAPGQFEPWQTRARHLLSIDPASEQYKRTAAIVDAATKGEMSDPTQGATYFLQPDIVRQRRGGTLPGWASGPSMKIGAHQFYYGGKGGPVMASKDDGTVSGTDVEDTARLLGIRVRTSPKDGGKATATNLTGAEGVSGVTPDEISETLRSLGITRKPTPVAPEAGTKPEPAYTPPQNGRPARVVIQKRSAGMIDQLIEGMPIVGPLFNKAEAAAEAGLAPGVDAIRKLLGKGPLNEPATFGERYSRNLADIVGANRQYAEENPIKSIIANLVGGTMLLGPLGATKIGGTLLGTYGPTLGSRVLTGMGGGASIGALDALLRGENVASGAQIGAAGGAAGPLIGEAVRGGTGWLVNNVLPRTGPLRELSGTSVRKLVEPMRGETPASLAGARERMGPAGFLGDLTPGYTDVAGAVADIPGPGKAVVRGAYQTRADNQAKRVEAALTKAMGKSTNVEDFRNFWTETRAAASDPLYEQFRSMKVQPTDKLKELIPRLEAAGAFGQAEELAGISGKSLNVKFFTGGPNKEFPTAESWDLVKRGLDRRIDQAYRAGDKTLGRELVKLKGETIGEIEKTSAGKVWNQARREFAERSAILDQLEAGRDTFLGGRSGLSVDEFMEEIKHLKGPELAARIVGARSAADEAMGATMRGDTTLRNKLLAPNNRKKMELLLGKQKADDLARTMEQEYYLGNQYQNVVGGSQTTPKKERVNAMLPPSSLPWNPDLTQPLTWAPPSWREGMRPSNIAAAWRGQKYQEAANQLAPLISIPASAPEFRPLVKAIRQEAQRRAAVENAAARAGSVLSGLITGPVSTTARREYFPTRIDVPVPLRR